MKKNIEWYLRDILDCIEKIEEYTKGLTKNNFLSSSKEIDAV